MLGVWKDRCVSVVGTRCPAPPFIPEEQPAR